MSGILRTTVQVIVVGAATSLLTIGSVAIAVADPNPVPVPGNYEPGSGDLHDYCTSPMPNEYLGADFKGACARHDQCMEKHRDDQVYGDCHDDFESDLQAVCNWAFSSTLDYHRRKSCNTYVDGVIAVVRAKN
ncbi:hypothetical protein HLB23_14200 [Nocardia uniformis]|uniref:Uncharacterized protein n=1 Tax=Nocardia uniformis TaxID=53432 RepID=A0A849CD64_9NOCA|nr:hypothetical protein [Nocardia uniformis]NNH71001.1 hypothetical protein [Nocardia uniformis]